jgi:hypothetical protein
VNVDRELRIFLPDGTNETEKAKSTSLPSKVLLILQFRGLRFEKTCHVLDTKHMDALFNEQINEIHIVLESVFLLLGRSNIAAIADDSFANAACPLCRVYTKSHLYRSEPISHNTFRRGTDILCGMLETEVNTQRKEFIPK